MIARHPHIVLFQPEIPQNTGSIGRLAAGAGARLHLITPFGFSAADKNLRRAGLDYWPFLDLEIHDRLEEVLEQFPGRCLFFSKKAEQPYWQAPLERDVFIFGRETSGLPDELARRFPEAFYRIPMYHPGVRSHNLANAVSIVVYDYLRRIDRRREVRHAPGSQHPHVFSGRWRRHVSHGGAGFGGDRKSTRLNSSHIPLSRMPSSA